MTTRSVLARAGATLAAAVVVSACGTDDPPRVAPPVRTTPALPQATTAAPVAGPTVGQIADALDDISPLRHPRDNTGSCAAKAGCLGLVTAGTVSIYQWPDVSAATRYIGDGGNAERVGLYVLSYRTREQRSTPPGVRQAYADKARELVGPTP